jgi:hypothetical protein
MKQTENSLGVKFRYVGVTSIKTTATYEALLAPNTARSPKAYDLLARRLITMTRRIMKMTPSTNMRILSGDI